MILVLDVEVYLRDRLTPFLGSAGPRQLPLSVRGPQFTRRRTSMVGPPRAQAFPNVAVVAAMAAQGLMFEICVLVCMMDGA